MTADPFQLYYAHVHVGEILDPSLEHLNTEDLTGFGTFRQLISRGADPLTNRLIDYIEMSIEVHRVSQTAEGANVDPADEFDKFRDITYSEQWHRTASGNSGSTPLKNATVFFDEDNCVTWSEDE